MSGYVYPVIGGGSVTSGFGSRAAPKAGASTNHRGVDIGGRIGQPIVATSSQRVTYAGRASGYGNVIYAVDDQGYQHRYAHLNSINAKAGQTYQAGTPIGTLGNSGNSTGPHLHYEIRDKNGNAINPSKILSGAKKLNAAAKDLLNSDAGRAGLAVATGGASEAAFAVGDALGITGGESWIDQIKRWIKESGFFQRIALALFAFILLFAAFYLFKGSVNIDLAKKAKGLVT